MITSMTGYAALTHEDERCTLGVTIRAVNHRFLDLQLRLPSALAAREPSLRALVQKRLTRGRIELSLTLQVRQPPAPQIELHEEFVRALAAAVDVARDRGLVRGDLTPGDLLRMPQALVIRERHVDGAEVAESLAAAVDGAVDAAITQLEQMRLREGQHLQTDLTARKNSLATMIEQLAAAAEDGRRGLEARLAARAQELLAIAPADPAHLAQEVVRFAHRSDISEELSRFRGHLAHWEALTADAEPSGRKFDFLLQEMNREINTLGSKADGLGVSELVIRAKAELERMREQVQNVE